jgi:hypothetical protein
MIDQATGGATQNGEGPGANRVGRIGIATVTIYLVVLSSALLYCLIILWPHPISPQTAAPESTKEATHRVVDTSSPANDPDPDAAKLVGANYTGNSPTGVHQPDPSEINFVIWKFPVDEERRLLLLVVCAGALGSLVHGLRSIYWYVGNRNLIWSWIPKYLIQPFGASVLAVVFYLVIRGGFFSADASYQHTSPFGFMALSAMVGMFSEQAVLKLKEISETFLSKPPPGKDSKPQLGADNSHALQPAAGKDSKAESAAGK